MLWIVWVVHESIAYSFIGYHANFLKTLMVILSNQTKADVKSTEQEQEHRSTRLAIALTCC